MIKLKYRAATPADIAVITEIHIQSWRSAYALILEPSYLAGPIEADRLGVWTERLVQPASGQVINVAINEHDEILGFICAYRDAHPRWGSYIDNLHVHPALRGQRIGEQLLALTARELLAGASSRGLNLLVFQANEAGLRFYTRLGGVIVDQEFSEFPAAEGKILCRIHWRAGIGTRAGLNHAPEILEADKPGGLSPLRHEIDAQRGGKAQGQQAQREDDNPVPAAFRPEPSTGGTGEAGPQIIGQQVKR